VLCDIWIRESGRVIVSNSRVHVYRVGERTSSVEAHIKIIVKITYIQCRGTYKNNRGAGVT
jgi:hypothetical protein